METKNFQFEIKGVSDDGIIEGYASTFGGKADSYGDIISEGAFRETLAKGGRNGNGVPLLWQHNFGEPLGKFVEMTENKKGLKVVAELAMEVQRAKEAHALAKKSVINSFSIGWDFIRDNEGKSVDGAYEINERTGNRHLKRVELWEVSLVTFPANVSASINKVKSIFRPGVSVREIEAGLHASGLSIKAAKFIISMMDKDKLSREGAALENSLLNIVEGALKRPNQLEEEFLKIAKTLK